MPAKAFYTFCSLVTTSFLVLTSCNSGYSPDTTVRDLPETIDYNLHVQPILSDRCYSCHGPDENARKAELRLDTEQGLFGKIKDSGGKVPVHPKRLRGSLLIDRVTSHDPEFQMPPPESKLSKLNDKEIAILAKWIEQGAEWKPHWSFIPPKKPEVPEVEQSDWLSNEIDNFVLSRLEKEGLKPSPEAEREILFRRLNLDLTGLPPSVEEIDKFIADKRPDAYEKVVDRLLDSPHYGERMAVDWLDLARYADTHGYQADFYRPHWPWRDWVIKAYNENLPYDEFVTWQLAGDLMPDATKEQILATGFNRNHAQNNEGGIVEEEFRVEYVADRTQTFSTAFLGLTMQCARCHDHKYDPIGQEEFYQLYSFFNNVDESGQTTFFRQDIPGPTLLLPDKEVEEKLAYLDELTSSKGKKIKALEQLEGNFEDWLSAGQKLSTSAPKSPIAHYTLDQIKNDHIPNVVSSAKAGMLINPINEQPTQDSIQMVSAKKGRGLKLRGDNALSFPGVGRFSRAEPFSIGLWVNIPSDLEKGVIFHSNKGSALYTYKGYQVSVEDGRFDLRLAHNFPYNSIHLLSEQPVPREDWVHLMLTYDGSSKAVGARLYLNGEEVKMKVKRDNLYKDIIFHSLSKNAGYPIVTHLKVGARWRGKGLTNGMVDEIMVFDRELTALEVNMTAGEDNLAKLLKKEAAQLTESEMKELSYFYRSNYDQEFIQQNLELTKARKQQNDLVEKVMEVMVMDEMEEVRSAHILDRGAYDQPLGAVEPGTPNTVMPFENNREANRLGLAKWLFDRENPLPARVTVNRFWQQYFGTGLVSTTEDFGSQGQRPSHPLLLDWLAMEFMESGWDIKHMQKKIVMSATYRQSSATDTTLLARDPDNRLLARGPSGRLSAEMLRDLVLTASGLLARQIGGPSVKPYQPEGLWSFSGYGAKYEHDQGDDLYRRSLYTFWKRTNPPPAMNIFDAPNRAYCVVKREKTATPLQALVLLNDPQFLEASRLLAERIIREGGVSTEEKIAYGYRLLTGRHPGSKEVQLLVEQYNDTKEDNANDLPKIAGLLSAGEHPVDHSLDKFEVAAFTTVASTIMNFDATIRKR